MPRLRSSLLVVALTATVLAATASAQNDAPTQILIRNVRVFDGTNTGLSAATDVTPGRRSCRGGKPAAAADVKVNSIAALQQAMRDWMNSSSVPKK